MDRDALLHVTVRTEFHAERREDAAYWSGGGNVTEAAFDQAAAKDLYG